MKASMEQSVLVTDIVMVKPMSGKTLSPCHFIILFFSEPFFSLCVLSNVHQVQIKKLLLRY